MKIEHIGLLVKEPHKTADWYVNNFNLKLIKSVGDNNLGASFVKDEESGTLIEFAKMPNLDIVDYNTLEHLQIHIAFEVAYYTNKAKNLVLNGADIVDKDFGVNHNILIKDPWGLTIQLINRV